MDKRISKSERDTKARLPILPSTWFHAKNISIRIGIWDAAQWKDSTNFSRRCAKLLTPFHNFVALGRDWERFGPTPTKGSCYDQHACQNHHPCQDQHFCHKWNPSLHDEALGGSKWPSIRCRISFRLWSSALRHPNYLRKNNRKTTGLGWSPPIIVQESKGDGVIISCRPFLAIFSRGTSLTITTSLAMTSRCLYPWIYQWSTPMDVSMDKSIDISMYIYIYPMGHVPAQPPRKSDYIYPAEQPPGKFKSVRMSKYTKSTPLVLLWHVE